MSKLPRVRFTIINRDLEHMPFHGAAVWDKPLDETTHEVYYALPGSEDAVFVGTMTLDRSRGQVLFRSELTGAYTAYNRKSLMWIMLQRHFRGVDADAPVLA